MLVTGVLLVVTSFAPARFVAPWSGELEKVAWIPFVPLGLLLGQVRSWLRPAIPELDLQSPLAQQLVKERDSYRGLYHAAKIEAERLARELQETGRARAADHDPRVALVPASVLALDGVGRNPLIRIGQGRAAGIVEGDVVVHGGDAIVGRVVSPIGRGGCSVMPIWSPLTKRVNARARDPVGGIDLPLQVSVTASGALVAQAPTGIELPQGTHVLLDDREWSPEAQGMMIGTVLRIEQPDESPLQRLHVLQPAAPSQGLDVVVVKFPRSREPS